MIKDSLELINLRAKFRVYYDNELHAKFAGMEVERKKYLKYFWILSLLMLVVLPILSLVCLIHFWDSINLEQHINDDTIGIVLFIVSGIIAILCGPNIKYRRGVKLNVMEYFIKFFGSFSYKHNYTIDEQIINKSALFSSYNLHSGDDFFVGTYKDVGITISEEKLIQHTGGKRSSTKTVFGGIMIMLDMNKNFNGKTVVKKDSGWFLNKFSGCKGCKRVELEDVEFEKTFEIFSDDQIEARYLLTTAFMERILRLRDSFFSKKIEFSFFDNKLFMAVSTKDNMFETSSLFKSSTDYKSIEKVFEQFYAVFSIIDVLKLHQKAVL